MASAPPVYYPVFAADIYLRFYGEKPIFEDTGTTDIISGTYEKGQAEGRTGQGGEKYTDWFVRQSAIPNSFRLERNDFFESDKLDLTLKYVDFPIDPRAIRAVRLELYGALATQKDFARGLEKGKDRPGPMMDDRNLLFVGYADEYSNSLWKQGADTVSFQCRDYQGLFEDTPMDQTLAIGPQVLPLKNAIEFFLGAYPALREIKVKHVNGLENEVLDIMAGPSLDGNISLWDFLEQRLISAGVIPYVWRDTLYLMRAGDVFSHRDFGWRRWPWGKRRDLPKEIEQLLQADGVLSVPGFIAGHNILDVSTRRRLSSKAAPPIVTESFRPWDQTVIRGEYPPASWRKKHPNRAVMQAADSAPRKVVVPWFPNVDEKLLEKLAKDLFHLHSRAEYEIEFKTMDLSSVAIDRSEADVLHLMAGDPVAVIAKGRAPAEELAKGHVNDDLGALMSLSREEIVQHFVKVGYDKAAAATIATAVKGGFPTRAKVRRSVIEHSAGESGSAGSTSVTITAAEYMEGKLDPVGGLDAYPDPFGSAQPGGQALA